MTKPKEKRSSMPSRSKIARYWINQGAFPWVGWAFPGCFACGYSREFAEGEWEGASAGARWNVEKLERCHVIGHAEGGTEVVSNLVLLCRRCHLDAPVVGASSEAMLHFIRHRDSYILHLWEGLVGEMARIRPSLALELSSMNLTHEDLDQRIRDTATANGVGIHNAGGGNMLATIAWVCKLVTDEEWMNRARIAKDARLNPPEPPRCWPYI